MFWRHCVLQMKTKITHTQLLVFVISVLLLLPVAGLHRLFIHQVEVQKQEMLEHLKSITEMQVQAITMWHQSRFWDARLLKAEILRVLAERSPANLENISLAAINGRLQGLLTSGYYISGILVDISGEMLASATFNAADSVEDVEGILEHAALLQDGIHLTDVHKGQEREHLTLVIPLDQQGIRLGALLLEIDPQHFLFRLNQSRMPHNVHVESILHQQEGEGFRRLSGASHRVSDELPMPLESRMIPAFTDPLGKDEGGGIEFIDRWGVEVVGYLKKIPNTPWFVVTKADLGEVLDPLIRQRNWMAALGILFFGMAGLALFYAWKHQQSKIVARSEALLRAVIEQTQEGVFLTDEDGNTTLANPAFSRISGYSVDELMKLRLTDMLPQGEQFSLLDKDADAEGDCRAVKLQRKSGQNYIAEISRCPIEVNENQLVLGGDSRYH